jgi:vacuolar-type H+-ATPase subunit E/Vma4
VSQSLSGETWAALIETVAKNAASGATMALNSEDTAALKDGLISRLQAELKNGVVFASRADRARGLTISFDQGKSCFDLTDEALVSYFTAFVRQDIAELLK